MELAAVPIVGGVIREPKSWLVHPDEPIKHFATRIHGLTNKDVADAPLFAVIKDEVLSTFTGATLVAHNAHVDVDVLTRKLDDWAPPEVFDTLKLAHRLLPDAGSYLAAAIAIARRTHELDSPPWGKPASADARHRPGDPLALFSVPLTVASLFGHHDKASFSNLEQGGSSHAREISG